MVILSFADMSPLVLWRLFRQLWDRFSLEREKDDPAAIVMAVERDVSFRGINLWVLIAAVLIASVGLNVNSTAVIIGAMLISPLMGPIIGIGVSLATYNIPLLKKSLRNFIVAVFFSILTSATYFFLSPLKEPQSELLARTSPSFWDVLIAFFGGLAGIVAATGREKKLTVISGVAIATALMPPLCTVGYGIANLQPRFIFGAFYLFSINAVFISTAAYLIAQLLRFPNVEISDVRLRRRIRTIALGVVIGTLVPSLYLSWQLVRNAIREERLRLFIQRELVYPQTSIISYRVVPKEREQILEVVIIGEALSEREIQRLEQALRSYELPIAGIQIIQGNTSSTVSSSLIETLYERTVSEVQKLTDSLGKLHSRLRLYESEAVPTTQLLSEIRLFMPELQSLGLNRITLHHADSTSPDTAYVVVVKSKGAFSPELLQTWLQKRLKTSARVLILPDEK